MSEIELSKLLDAMTGTRFQEFILRKTSFAMVFLRRCGSREAQFIVETNSNVSAVPNMFAEYEDAIPQSSLLLYGNLERRLTSITAFRDRVYQFTFDGGAAIYIADPQRQWDNVFSVRAHDWPEPGTHGAYFF